VSHHGAVKRGGMVSKVYTSAVSGERGYPAHLESILLMGGEKVTIRPVRPADAAMVAAFVSGLSDETWQLRFFSGRHELSNATLIRATRVDYHDHLALIATVGARSVRQVAGARYIALGDGKTCEFSIVVGDDLQGHGLGRVMMRKLIEAVKATRLEVMMGYVATRNRKMRGLCQALGFTDRAQPGDPRTRIVELALRPASARD
jgi:acetyltransferase